MVKFAIGTATRCIPAILIPLAIGIAINKPRGGMVIASGAFTSGLGSFQQLHLPGEIARDGFKQIVATARFRRSA